MTERIPAESEFVTPAWVEQRLEISRPTRISLEQAGQLHPIRLTPNGHRKYRRAEVDALAAHGSRLENGR